MDRPSDGWADLRDRVIGLGEHSARKSYYPELQQRLRELEETREQLAASNRYLQAVLNAAVEYAIIATDTQGLITVFNHGAERMLSYRADELLGYPLQTLHRTDELQHEQALLSQHLGRSCSPFEVVTAQARPTEPLRREWTYLRKDGSQLPVSLSVTAIADHHGTITGYLAIATDLTERKQTALQHAALTQQLQTAQRLESLGRLAGGVAHDLNNLLTPILMYADLLCSNCGNNPKMQTRVDGIREAASKARDLTGQLLAFGRRQAMEVASIDLNQVITALLPIVRRTIRENVRIELHLAEQLSSLMADRIQLEQIVLNLAVNAQDAMPEGGVLVIDTADILFTADSIGMAELQPGQYIRLQVTDTGCGMTQEILQHIYEPFYTTKGPGKGSGLGLATVFGIVTQLGGAISVTSETASGTSFSIYLPASKQIPGGTATPESPAEPLTSLPPLVILLVEDNPIIRTALKELLEEQGCSVTAADGPLQAKQLFTTMSPLPELLLSDVIMPEQSGPELYEQLHQHSPGLKALYISGYSEHAMEQRHLIPQRTAYLQKPFNRQGLLEKINALLCPPSP